MAYIKGDLKLPAEIQAWSRNKMIAAVRIKMSKEKGKGAMITTNWNKVVDDNEMKKGQVYMFLFRGSRGGLKLIVNPVVG
jgi:hypothetical protein